MRNVIVADPHTQVW